MKELTKTEVLLMRVSKANLSPENTLRRYRRIWGAVRCVNSSSVFAGRYDNNIYNTLIEILKKSKAYDPEKLMKHMVEQLNPKCMWKSESNDLPHWTRCVLAVDYIFTTSKVTDFEGWVSPA